MIIFIAVVSLSILGLFSGLILGLAYKKFEVIEDPKIEEILEMLPGSNCGACGFAGCRSFAEALVKGKVDPSLCLQSSKNAVQEMAGVLGVQAKEVVPFSAYLLCNGGTSKTQNRFIYNGAPFCKAAQKTGGGFKSCTYGCLGFGDCVLVCPVSALSMSKDNLPVVDREKCIACGKCILECPRKLFVLLPKEAKYFVGCSSTDKGALVKKKCTVGCIGCLLCERACKFEAIKIENNLAEINQDNCTKCGECLKVCPTKCILDEELLK